MASKHPDRPGSGSALGILTFNIRQDVEVDGENRWEYRRDKVVGLFHSWAPDVAELQEPFRHQLDYLLGSSPGYSYVGVGRDDGLAAGGSPVPVDGFASAGEQSKPGTYHGFTGDPEDHPIDYIFVSPEWKVAECRILPDSGPPYLSDHFPLSAVLES